MRESWRGFAFWLAIGMSGHGATLALTMSDAWSLGFRSASDAFAHHRIALVLLLIVAVTVGAGARRMIVALFARYGAWRVLCFVTLWTLATTLFIRSRTAFAWSLGITAVAHLANFGALVLAVRAMPPGLVKLRRFVPWGFALAATSVSILIAHAVFETMPHVPDDVAYYFQAKTYAAGLAYRPAPPEPALFEQWLIAIKDGKWFSVFPPGWPLVLALGFLAGVPWLVNPLLAGLAVLLTHRLVHRTVSPAAADVTAVMLACSPSFLFVSSTYMAHTSSIVCTLAALLGVERAASSPTVRRAAGFAGAAGGFAGLLFLTRPLEGVIVGVVVLARALGVGGRRLTWPAIAAGTLSGAAVMSIFFINNRLLTGNALIDPIQDYFNRTFYRGSNDIGFGANRGNLGWGNDISSGHSPLEAARNVNSNLSLADTELFGWAFGSMLMVGLFLVLVAPAGSRSWVRQSSQRSRTPEWLVPWAAIAFLTITATALYWYSGADLGPRYWLQCIVPFAVLGVLGAFRAAEHLGVARRRAGALLVVASFFGAALLIPWRASTKYHRYRGVVTDLRDLRSRALDARDLVLIRSRVTGMRSTPFSDFGPGIILNEIPLGSGPIFARATDQAAVTRLQNHMPGRRVWILEAPSLTTNGFAVVASPLTARDYLR